MNSEQLSCAAEIVRTARQRRGLTQRGLADLAEVPQSTVAKVETGRQQPSLQMLQRLVGAAGFRLRTELINNVRPSELLAERASMVASVLAEYPIRQASVFGSVARGDDRPDSDLDLLVELEPGTPFEKYVGLEDELAEVLGCPVDVVTTKELDSNELLRRRVMRHVKPLEIAA